MRSSSENLYNSQFGTISENFAKFTFRKWPNTVWNAHDSWAVVQIKGKFMKNFVRVAVALTMATSGPAFAANLLTNGSFETGSFSGWSVTGNDDGHPPAVLNYNSATGYPTGAFGEAIPVDNAATLSPDAAGLHAAYFVSDAAVETLSQTIFLAAGKYNIGFSAYVPFNGYANAFNASFVGDVADVPLATFTVDGSNPGVWKGFTGVANIAVAGNYKTSFTFTSGPAPAGDVVIDRVYVTAAVPEPETWAMLLGGFGLAGTAVRRRRRAETARVTYA